MQGYLLKIRTKSLYLLLLGLLARDEILGFSPVAWPSGREAHVLLNMGDTSSCGGVETTWATIPVSWNLLPTAVTGSAAADSRL